MSEDRSLPEAMEQFVLQHIDSVAELEALLLMRAEPVVWDPSAVGQRLYVTTETAHALLETLVQRGFLAHDHSGYRYAPAPTLAPLVDALAASYNRLLIPLANLIHSKSPAIRRFADAFRLRGDKSDKADKADETDRADKADRDDRGGT